MKFNEYLSADRLLCVVALAGSMIRGGEALGATDPRLEVSLTSSNNSVILSWASFQGVPYQVEAASVFDSWTNISPVMTGTGVALSFSQAQSGLSPEFIRVKRLFPAAPGSAAFDPATGVLTIVADRFHSVINVANDGTGTITVNSGAIPITNGPATVANTVLIQVLGSPGNDQITVGNSLPPAHLFGAEGNDTLTGGSSSDMLVGGPGSDTLIGGQGNDLIYPDGDDTVIWNPGSGSDVVQGVGTNNTLIFNGANVSENITLSANGSRLLLTRDVANIVLDVGGVQAVNISALGGADTVVVNDLTGTGVAQVNIDLAAVVGTTNGDALADTVVISGTPGADTFDVAANGAAVEITGVGAVVRVVNAELANDRIAISGVGGDRVNVNGTDGPDTMQVIASPVAGYVRVTASGFTAPVDVNGSLTLSVNGLGGPDVLTAGNGLATIGVPLILDGGDGDDTIAGGDANETIIGGAGNDVVSGGRGNDLVLLGEGSDTFTWNPGDGSDTVEGEGGSNTLIFNGANIGEQISLSANGPRLRLTRDVANIVMDASGMQTVNVQALGGADNVTVNSLAGTGVTQVNIDLAANTGVGDSAADTVTVNGTEGPDTIDATAFAGFFQVTGLVPQIQIAHPEASLDTLVINGLGGTDTINVGPGVTGLIKVIANQ